MEKSTQYPDMIGYKLVRDLSMDQTGTTLAKCVNISKSITSLLQRSNICEKSSDLHFVILAAELAIQVGNAKAGQSTLSALENLLDLGMRPMHMKIVFTILEPALSGK